ncbi:hypothetical protein C8R46DRAFT_878180, partial [Mycena filopes]
IQFFFKQIKRKKAVKVSKGTKRKRGAEPEEVVVEEGDILLQAEEEIAQVLDNRDASDVQPDDSQEVHDTHVARSIRDKAIALMRTKNVIISDAENRNALGIFPKVAGLAKKVHDSSTVAAVFDGLVNSAKARGTLQTDKTALDRRCPTRWNSDFQCLEVHALFKPVIQQLTATTDLKLKSFALTEAQWKLVDQLSLVLGIFDEMTLYFSQADTPLIADAIGALEDLLVSLKMVMDDTEMPNVIRVAAAASKLVCEKYFNLTGECEAYSLAIVMTPNKKLNWFRERGWSDDKVKAIKDLAVSRWEESYKKFALPSSSTTAPSTSVSTASTSVSSPLRQHSIPCS